MSTKEDLLVYDTERLAFAGTPLGDRLDRHSLIRETCELAAHPSIVPLVGQVTVTEGTARYAANVAHAAGQRIVFAPNLIERFVPVHELAHVVHRRAALGGRSHGPEYRAVYADLAGIAYGYQYRDLLWHAFDEVGLHVHPARLPMAPSPVIDVDRLAGLSGGVRWL